MRCETCKVTVGKRHRRRAKLSSSNAGRQPFSSLCCRRELQVPPGDLHWGLLGLWMTEKPSLSKYVIAPIELASKIGLNEALAANKLDWLLGLNGGRKIAGEHWIFNTYKQWKKEHFPFWSIATIQRVFSRLEKLKLILSCQPDGRMSRKKYYRINKELLARLSKIPDHIKLRSSDVANCDLPKQGSLNRESEESKGTSLSADVVIPSESKPSARSKEELLRHLPVPDYPCQDEFNDLLDEYTEYTPNYRQDLYHELCRNKWHQWSEKAHRWIPIRDWRKYVIGLDKKIAENFER